MNNFLFNFFKVKLKKGNKKKMPCRHLFFIQTHY